MTETGVFEAYLSEAIQKKRYVLVQYLNDLHEFHYANAVLKMQGDLVLLSNGDLIDPHWIIRIDEMKAPGFEAYDDFTCDC